MMIKRFKDLRYRIFYGALLRRGYEVITLCAPGSICPWNICPTGLKSSSVVYGGGIGSDISFEHELVKKFGCQIVLFDPSPTGRKTMELPENKIPNFHYFPMALADHVGTIKMSPPVDEQGDSWFAQSGGTQSIEVPCTDLQSLMARNGHNHIDLLKLDIEGSEYEVIKDILSKKIPIRQICVEYHHGIVPGVRRSQTISSMLSLIRAGYKLIDQAGANHTFIRPA